MKGERPEGGGASVNGEQTDRAPRLRLIRGGMGRTLRRGRLRIEAAPPARPPFPVEAVGAEEDTYLVLSADPAVEEPAEHPVRIWTAAHEAQPVAPGTVVVRRGRPLRLLAVVHDLSARPTWKEEWVASALEELFRLAERLGLRSLGLPPVGNLHGALGLRRFVELLDRALERVAPAGLERLWLVVDRTDLTHVRRLLTALPSVQIDAR